MPFYNVHYPDGAIKRHEIKYENHNLPGLDKVFYNGRCITSFNYYQISEMGEEDIWIDKIPESVYYFLIDKDIDNRAENSFAAFKINQYDLLEF